MGKGKITAQTIIKISIIVGLLAGVVLYQNCSPGGTGNSAFNLSSGSSGTGGAITLNPLTFSSNPVGAGATEMISLTMSGGNTSSINCTFTVFDSKNNTVGTNVVPATLNGSLCSTTIIASSTAGNYAVNVTVQDSSGNSMSEGGIFTVSSSANPTPFPTPTPAPTPPPGTTPPPTGTCTFGNTTLSVGQTTLGYDVPSVPVQLCEPCILHRITVTCQANGTVTPTPAYPTCVPVGKPGPCL